MIQTSRSPRSFTCSTVPRPTMPTPAISRNWSTACRNRLKSSIPGRPAPTISEVAELINARHSRTTEDRSTRYLIVHGLQRFRDLRKPDDDYSFGRSNTVTPATKLHDHSSRWAVGRHALPDVVRHADQRKSSDGPGATARVRPMRVLFQMSATDSSHLIDSPLASRLAAIAPCSIARNRNSRRNSVPMACRGRNGSLGPRSS